MKKHGLTKILGILLLLVVIVCYILNGRSDTKSYVGLVDLIFNVEKGLYYFFYIALFILAVGGFYGVLNRVPAYKKLLDSIVAKIKPLGKKFIFIIILTIAVITSLTGITLPLLIFVPFIISVILLAGYDKLVAISSTVVSMMVGYIGGIFVTVLNPSTYTMVTYETLIGLDDKFANTFPKILLLFAGVTLLIFFVNKHIKAVEEKKVKYELNDEELHISEVKGNYNSIRVWPLVVVLSFLFVLLVMGLIPWSSLFEIDVFSTFHTWLTELNIKDFAIVPNIISSSLVALGEWNSMGDSMLYMILCTIIALFTILISLIGRLKLNDALDGFVDGMKKVIPIVVLSLIAYTVLITAYGNGFMEGLIESYGKFNYAISGILAFIGSILNVDSYYIIGGIYQPIVNLITDETIYDSVAILFQGIYGVFSIVGPTSIILIFVLEYMNVPYTTWIKYIWRFAVSLMILVALITLLVVLL